MKPTAQIHAAWKVGSERSIFNHFWGQHLRVSDVDPYPAAAEGGRKDIDGWKISWEATIPSEWDNGNGAMHGAAAAWIVDTCTSAAIMAHSTENFWGPPLPSGVSLAINMTYFQPAKIGADIVVEVEVLKCSATTANIKCDILDRTTRQLLASGTHIKAWRAKNRAKL